NDSLSFVLDVFPGHADGREPERGIEPFRRLGRKGSDQDLISPLVTHMRDCPGDYCRSDAALAKIGESEQILDHAHPIGAEHAGAIGAVHAILARQEELIRWPFLAIAGDYPLRNLGGYSHTLGTRAFDMVLPDERVERLPVGVSRHRTEVNVSRISL